MPRLDQLSEIQRQSALYFPCLENDTAPWAPWTKELSNTKVALVSRAGLPLRTEPIPSSDSRETACSGPLGASAHHNSPSRR